jgi:membrane-associated phospholipid phosphatase
MPDTKKFGALFFVLAMGVGYSRMYLAAHFFSDVYVGSVLGTGITTIGYLLMEQVKDRMTQNKTTEAV